MIFNNDLSKKEYKILSCAKSGWDISEKRYLDFMNILKRYIEYWATPENINFNGIYFPEMIIDEKLFGNKGIHIFNCIFYGEVHFKNIEFSDLVRIQDCIFRKKVYWNKLIFKKDSAIMCNQFIEECSFENCTFYDELYFSSNEFNRKVFFENIEFNQKADFVDNILKDGCEIKRLQRLEFFEWDSLFCIYNTPECIWDAREEYINHYMSEKNMNNKLKIDLTLEIKSLFPEVKRDVNKRLLENANDWSCYFFLEAFVDITNKYLRKREYTKAIEHLVYVEKKMKNGNDELVSLLDVAYIENLLWDLERDEKKRAWKYLPIGIQNRYTRIWGSFA